VCVFFAPKPLVVAPGRDEYTYRGFFGFLHPRMRAPTEGRNATLPSKRTGASMGGFKKHFFLFLFFLQEFFRFI
jgi:hypothetical protein